MFGVLEHQHPFFLYEKKRQQTASYVSNCILGLFLIAVR